MSEKRFGPFFWTQFLGAFTDNLFKNALVIMVAFQAAASEAEIGKVTSIASGLFILPFFLFSPIAGQIADKFDKAMITRRVKIAEILIMLLAAIGFGFAASGAALAQSYLIGILFLMGVQSSFFGPVKYSIIPQHLPEEELMEGTGLVEMGTFVAILTGTMAGGILVAYSVHWVSASLIAMAIAGWLASRGIPAAASSSPELTLQWNPITEYRSLYHIVRKNRSVMLSIVGISWFWLFGSIVLAQLPNLVKHFVNGDETVATFFLGLWTLSVAVGSVLTNKLSDTTIELGLVPLGALGLTVFALDLGCVDYALLSQQTVDFMGFLRTPAGGQNLRILFDLAGMGLAASFFIVPLYALVQHRSDEKTRSQVIAGNNILNALFMVLSAGATVVLYGMGMTTTQLFVFVAVLNSLASVYIFMLLPEFVLRFVLWALAKTIYRLRYDERHTIPREGACLLVPNHVSFIDWFVITAACQRPVHFVMYHKIFQIPGLSWVFKICKAIPIAPAKEDAACKERAFELIADYLEQGEVVCIFPEGQITRDGELNRFQRGAEQVLATTPVPVIPIALKGLWGSFFSRKGGGAMTGLPHPSRRTIEVAIGQPMPPETTSEEMQAVVADLLATPMP